MTDEQTTVEPQPGTDHEDVNLDADDIVGDDAIVDDVEIVDDDKTGGAEEPDDKVVTEDTPEPDDPKEPDGQTDESDKTVETVEDIKVSRAYHQEKAQQEAEARKAAEAELAEVRAKMKPPPEESQDGIESYRGLTKEEKEHLTQMQARAQVQPQPTEQSPSTPQEQSAEDGEQYQDFESDTDKRLNALTQMMGVLVQNEQQRVAEAKQQQESEYTKEHLGEVNSVYGQVDAYQSKYEIPQNVRDEAEQEAAYFVPLEVYAKKGGPTRRAQLVLSKLGQYVVSSKATQLAEARTETDKKKVEDAKKLTQPASTGPSAPGKATAKTANDEAADDIADDDPLPR